MKKTGICPKCGGKDIVDSDKISGDRAIYHRWVCLDCGFVEMYSTDKNLIDLKKMRERGKI